MKDLDEKTYERLLSIAETTRDFQEVEEKMVR